LTAKDYLLQIPALRRQISAKCSLVDDYIDEACRATSRLTAVNYGGTDRHSRVEVWIDKKIDAEREEIEPMRRELWRLEQAVIRVIGAMPPGRWARVIELRYLKGMGWSGVEEAVGLKKSQIFEVHGHALLVFAKTHNGLGIFPVVGAGCGVTHMAHGHLALHFIQPVAGKNIRYQP
jgi:hypothetical protein